MKTDIVLAHEFVEFIPEELKERTLYVSQTHGTAVHKCCCGCGREVVTPLSPTGWQLTFDGETVSLHPSIGNWSLPCQSHYFIKKNKVFWGRKWTKKQIARGRAQEARAKEKYYVKTQPPVAAPEISGVSELVSTKPRENLRKNIKKWLS
jgi:hypothetical protein